MSNIDPSKPEEGQATTESVRDNFQAAADEIDANAAAIAVLEPGGGGDFASFLAGYDDNGKHIEYAGDLNALLANSVYYINALNVTNEPLDGFSGGFLTNLQHPTLADWSTQVMYGQDTTGVYKQWQRQQQAGAWDAWVLVVDGAAAAAKPIGALEFGYDPNGILPGTWTQIPEGTFIMATVANADPAGGSNDAVVVAHNHTSPAHNHSAAAVPGHTHTLPRSTSTSNNPYTGFNSGNAIVDYQNNSGSAGGHTPVINAATATIDSAGESGTGKNRPLYLGVEAWRRTA